MIVKTRPVQVVARGTIVTVVAIAALALSGCAGTRPAANVEATVNNPAPPPLTVTVYSRPDCECCAQYIAYLEKAGFQLKANYIMYDDSLREKYPVPLEMQSCHITLVDAYSVEGHVPVEAIMKLLKEKPAIDGIVLPGMPAGSPGMSGQQRGAYAVSDGKISEFLTIDQW